MKLSTKRIAIFFMLTLCAVTLFGCVYFMPSGTAAAQTSPFAAAYFYDTLADENGNSYTLAKKFYEAIDEMHRTGDFKDGPSVIL